MKKTNALLSAGFLLLSLAWVYPVVMIFLNSLKKEQAITTSGAFRLPTAESFAGFTHYANAIGAKGFAQAFVTSLVITVTSVALILLCCSMCAWFIARVRTRITRLCYYLFVFSMVVPFQMLMFPLAALSDQLSLNTPLRICVVYLGFGAGLSAAGDRGGRRHRRLRPGGHLLPGGAAAAAAHVPLGGHPADHVGVE